MRPKILLDECISPKVAKYLCTEGFRITSCYKCGLLGKSDEDIMCYAVKRGYTICTKNRKDFEDQYKFCADLNIKHYGVLIVNDYRTEEVLISLRACLLQIPTKKLLVNQILYL